MKNTFEQFKECQQLLSDKKNIAITIHQNPDGDAMGAALGLRLVLKKLGHQVTVVSPNDSPEFLKWIPGSDEIINTSKDTAKAFDIIKNAEVIFCLDYNEAKRVGKQLSPELIAAQGVKIMIDHHPQPEPFTDYAFSDHELSSASELTYEFANKLAAQHIDKQVAECFFTGIMTDTGSFHFNSSNPRTFEIIGNLLSKKIDKDQIYSRVYDNYSADRMRLMGYCLNKKLVVMPEYHTAYISLTKQEMDEYNYAIGDSEGFVNYALSIKGVIFAVFFIEQKDLTKISFRSKGDFSTNALARKYFNGGGHLNASGGSLKENMEDTIAFFHSLLPEYKTEIVTAFNKLEE